MYALEQAVDKRLLLVKLCLFLGGELFVNDYHFLVGVKQLSLPLFKALAAGALLTDI